MEKGADKVKKPAILNRDKTKRNSDPSGSYDSEEMDLILNDVKSSRKVQEMRSFIQHGKVTTYEHCENVARLSYSINKKLSLHSDLYVLLVGAMLHDFYLYDWHNYDNGEHLMHGFTHPAAASANAKKYFNIDDKTKQVISTHMWPFNPIKVPTSREAWIVCIADKCVSLHETIFRR